MEQTIMTFADKYGLWPALFVVLFVYVLADSRNREKKYQELVKKLSDTINIEISSLKTKFDAYFHK